MKNERYEASFKAEAVNLVLSTDQSYADLARDLVGDITYIQVKQRWLYLAVVIDLYSRRMVGGAFYPNKVRESTRNWCVMRSRWRSEKGAIPKALWCAHGSRQPVLFWRVSEANQGVWLGFQHERQG